jgi:hypothetical protein
MHITSGSTVGNGTSKQPSNQARTETYSAAICSFCLSSSYLTLRLPASNPFPVSLFLSGYLLHQRPTDPAQVAVLRVVRRHRSHAAARPLRRIGRVTVGSRRGRGGHRPGAEVCDVAHNPRRLDEPLLGARADGVLFEMIDEHLLFLQASLNLQHSDYRGCDKGVRS